MKKVPLLLAMFCVSVSGFAQAAETFALFVSKLKAVPEESSILLTWRNPKDVAALPLVFRHAEEISPENLEQANLVARLQSGQESYRDRPLNDNPYYYAVLLEDVGGAVQRYLIPFRNRTSEPVRISVLPSEQSLATRITGIRAEVAADAIRIEFNSTRSERELLLFRSAEPILRSQDLLEAFSPVQLEAGKTRYIDYPIPGVEYYYAVVDAGLFKLGKEELVAGQNSTVAPVSVPLEVERVALGQPSTPPGPSKPALPGAAATTPSAPTQAAVQQAAATAPTAPIPPPVRGAAGKSISLPYLRLSADLAGERIPAGAPGSVPGRAQAFKPETKAAVERILSSAPSPAPSRDRVEILPGDEGTPGSGELAGLKLILRETLNAGDFRSAEEKLLGFLNIRRSPPLEARTRFYLAQAYYFQGLYQEALLEFVLAQDQLYSPVQPWIQSCFRMMWSDEPGRHLPD